MRKHLRPLALALAATMMLTACSGGSSTSATAASGTTAASTAGGTGSNTAGGAAGAAGSSTAAADAGGAPHGTTKDTLIIRLQSDPGTLDIVQGNITESMEIWSLCGNSLLVVKQDENGLYDTVVDDEYSMATGYTFDDDNCGITFNLREGVKWHDGSDFTADDVVFSILRYRDNATYSYVDFDDVQAIDSHTVHVGLKAPDAQALINVGAMFLCSKANTNEDDPSCFSKKYIGTGAWYVDSWVDGDSVTLKAFDDYFAGAPAIKTIVVRFINDASVAMMELETGGVDIVDVPDWSSVNSVMSGNYEGKIKYTGTTDLYLHHLWFNCSNDSPYKDIRVRHAVMYAVDREALIYGAFEGLGELAYTMESVTMGDVISLEDSWPFTHDIEKAKSLLAEAGYPDGFEATIINYGDQNDVLGNEIIANQLAEIGIKVSIESYDTPTWISRLTEQTAGWDMALRLYGGVNPMSRWTWLNVPQNTHVDPEINPEYKELHELSLKALGTLDADERRKIHEEIQNRWFDEWAYTLPIFQKIQYNLFADNLQGAERYGYYWRIKNAYFD